MSLHHTSTGSARLAPGGIVARNPCPRCARPPQYLAGSVVFEKRPEAKPHRFLVCWGCRMIRKVYRGEEWKSMSRRAA